MKHTDIFMELPEPQYEATFLRRPQRFLALMNMQDGSEELVYCANSGSMKSCLTSGTKAILWKSSDLKRKLRFTWRAVEFEGGWIGTDTHLSNRIVEEALKSKLVPGFELYSNIAREQNVAVDFKVDFILSGPQGDCLLEVKSATAVEDGLASYPNSLTPRGVKQLKHLTRKALEGQRSVLLFLIQRADVNSFSVSNSYDLAYAEAFDIAVASGVEVIAMSVSVSREGFGNPKVIPHIVKVG
jgi:sugar fermentation stimulation protein A